MRSSHQLALISSLEFTVFTDSVVSMASRRSNHHTLNHCFIFTVLARAFGSGQSFQFATMGEKVHLSIDSPTLAPRAARSSKTGFVIGLRAGFFITEVAPKF